MTTLSKSKFVAGLKCPRMLWRAVNAKDTVPEPDEDLQLIFDQGKEVGNWAKKLYPNGKEVEWTKDKSVMIAKTKELVKKRKVIFEGAFSYKNAYCEVDILVPNGKEWDLIEVKQSGSVNEDHILYLWEVAFQKYCLEGAGIRINRVYIMHLNTKYARKGKINPKKLLCKTDVTDFVSDSKESVEVLIKEQLKVIDSPKMPPFTLDGSCYKLEKCDICSKDLENLPENSVTDFYRLKKEAYEWYMRGKKFMEDIPEDWLNEKQQIQRECVISKKRHVVKAEIKKFVESLKYPLYLVDFETVYPAIPLFDGTHPFQQVPFQVSLHILQKNGKVEHHDFLADGPSDPREKVVSVLRKIGSKGTVLSFNMRFEKGRIKELQEAFPKKKWLIKINERMNDLMIPFSHFWYYDPKQRGSCSLKCVLPALTGKTYSGMEVGDGTQAQTVFFQMNYQGKPFDKEKTRKALLEYCEKDTQSLIDILRVLEKV